MIQGDNNCCLIQPAVFKCHTENLLRYFLPGNNSQRHFQRQPWPSECLFMCTEGGRSLSRQDVVHPALLSLHLSLSSICKHALKCLLMTELRDKLLLPSHDPNEWLNKWHTMHFRPLEMDLSHVFLNSLPTLYHTHSAWLLTRGAWCKECKLRASHVGF